MTDEKLRQEVDFAYKEWISEENREGGYDFDLCQKLRRKYHALRDELQKREMT